MGATLFVRSSRLLCLRVRSMNIDIVFKTQSGRLLKIDDSVIDRFVFYRQAEPYASEAGGVLLGRHLLGSANVVVDEVTEPMPGDERSRFGFRRGQRSHQRRIDETWHNSGGTCVYLGEWHTHPEPNPTPSHIDLQDWRRRLTEDKFAGNTLFFIIVGMQIICAWEGDRTQRTITPISTAFSWKEKHQWYHRKAH